MKNLMLALIILTSSLSFASNSYDEPPFDFAVRSTCEGCVAFGDYEADHEFPYLDGRYIQSIRFYYAPFDFDYVTLVSPYVEIPVMMDGDSPSMPNVKLGNLESGQEYFFKVGLVDSRGRILHFTLPGRSDERRHSVYVR